MNNLKSIFLTAVALLSGFNAFASNPVEVVRLSPAEVMVGMGRRAVSTRGDQSLNFKYHTQPNSAVRAGDTDEQENSAAIYLPKEVVNQFAGASITSVWVYSGVNSKYTSRNYVTDATVWVNENIFEDAAHAVKKRGKLSETRLALQEIKFDTPYVIKENTPVYIGFTVIRPTSSDATFVVDKEANNNGTGFWVNYENEGKRVWEDWSTQFGNLCVYATITGANLPQYDVSLVSASYPKQVEKNKDFTIKLKITNRSATVVEKVGIEHWVSDGAPVAEELTVTNESGAACGLNFGEIGYISYKTKVPENGSSISLGAKVCTVNGQPDTNPVGNICTMNVLCMGADKGWERKVVIEEGTGTWCPNCVRGLGAIDRIRDTYPGKMIAIGVHQNDSMQIHYMKGADLADPGHDYKAQLVKPHGGYPHAYFNRNESLGTSVGWIPDMINKFEITRSLPSVANVVGKVYYSSEARDSIRIEAETEYAFDSKTPYRIACVLLENGVGPHYQTNNVSGANIDCNGWETRPQVVHWLFNDVLRYVDEYGGVEGSVPATQVAGEKYPYTTTLPLHRLNSHKDFAVAILLINTATGQIENAAEVHCSPALPVWTGSGSVIGVLADEDAVVEYYDLQGRRVANPSTGVYIKRQGNKVTKIIK